MQLPDPGQGLWVSVLGRLALARRVTRGVAACAVAAVRPSALHTAWSSALHCSPCSSLCSQHSGCSPRSSSTACGPPAERCDCRKGQARGFLHWEGGGGPPEAQAMHAAVAHGGRVRACNGKAGKLKGDAVTAAGHGEFLDSCLFIAGCSQIDVMESVNDMKKITQGLHFGGSGGCRVSSLGRRGSMQQTGSVPGNLHPAVVRVALAQVLPLRLFGAPATGYHWHTQQPCPLHFPTTRPSQCQEHDAHAAGQQAAVFRRLPHHGS